MKNGHLLLFIAGLLALIYFWGSKNRDGVDSSEKTASAVRTRSLKLIEERISLEKEKTSSSASPMLDAALGGSVRKIKDPEKSCWERIRDQYQTNSDYLDESHQRLSDLVGNWFYANRDARPDVNIEESSPQGKFFLALAKAGLLEGSKIERDERQALFLLEQVAAADPQNSAPILFAAIIQKNLGNREHAEQLLKAANQSTHFDSYFKDFTFALFDGVKTPSDLLAAQEIWSTAPAPNFIALREILEESKQPNIADQLVKDGLRDDRERITDLSWTPIEYSIGKKLLDSYGTGTNIPEYRELLRKHPSTLGQSGERIVSKLDSTCDLESIQGEVETVRTYLDQVRSKGL